ncbi:hypothetical protein [Sediminibacillus albus]|uniref:Uncharacterized protein n=1 Tax=Sediminibacillus albus TaxID=407036 RepID=A0A1G9BBZ9_9BACI|nr:hypothetical protein [Sediminibacillus albus]SDK36594.1 hypothetical protein SAMN05216243_2918 [Sediminibacillus albus]
MKKLIVYLVISLAVLGASSQLQGYLTETAHEAEPSIFSFDLSHEAEPSIFSFDLSHEAEPSIFSQNLFY